MDDVDDDSLRVFVVWTAAIRTDHYEASIESRKLIPDARARHYWDGEQKYGYALAPVLGTRMDFAWDVYVVYEPGTSWGSAPPAPADWLHQKRSEDPERYLEEKKLEKLLKSLSK